jgi:GMP synthase-like glutamine amidotransferase
MIGKEKPIQLSQAKVGEPPFSRRQFLKFLAVAGGSLGTAGLVACTRAITVQPIQVTPVSTPIVVTKVVEATRLVEKIVEVVRVADTPTPTTEEKHGMIWYVDIEHEKALADPTRAPNFDSVRRQRTWVMEDISKMPAESILYQQVSKELVKEKDVRAIAISGNTADWIEYDFATFQPLFDIVQSGEIPVIGLCGGHQLIGLMYQAECGPLRKLKPGEPDPADWAPGWFKEVGYLPVQVQKEDPIFNGLGKEPIFFESHYWEIKQMPPGFELLASTQECRIQTIKHKQYPIYGTQFHPEVNSADYMDGRKLLANFFRIAGILKE